MITFLFLTSTSLSCKFVDTTFRVINIARQRLAVTKTWFYILLYLFLAAGKNKTVV